MPDTTPAPPTDTPARLPDNLALALDGLIHYRLAQFQARPDELRRVQQEAGDYADTLAECGDRLTAPGNFPGRTDRRARAEALTAAATALALGALQPGGITWAGMHWCTNPHPGCPNRRVA